MNRYRPRTFVLELILWIIAALLVSPLLALVNVSLKAPHNSSGAFAVSGEYTLGNYVRAWTEGKMGAAALNSIIVAVVSVLVVMLVCSMAAYPLARIGARWSRGAFYLFLIGLVIPAQLGLIPLFISIRDIGLHGTLAGVILATVGTCIPFPLFIVTTFLRDIPTEYEEAAALDGCGPIRTWWHVIVPLLRPALGTVAILTLIPVWNNFLMPLLMLTGTGNETLPVRISAFARAYFADWPAVFASLAISATPVLLCYFFLQKHIIKGFAGGLKG